MRVSDALRRFRKERQQFAIVVDENGSVDGIVTVADLLEEVVGKVYDERVTGPTGLPTGRSQRVAAHTRPVPPASPAVNTHGGCHGYQRRVTTTGPDVKDPSRSTANDR